MIYINLVFVIFDENASVFLKLQPGRNCCSLLGCCTEIQFNMSLKRGMSAFPPSLSRMKLCKYTEAMMTSAMLWSKLMSNDFSLLNFPFKRANALSITDLVELCMMLYLVSSSFRLPTSLMGWWESWRGGMLNLLKYVNWEATSPAQLWSGCCETRESHGQILAIQHMHQ